MRGGGIASESVDAVPVIERTEEGTPMLRYLSQICCFGVLVGISSIADAQIVRLGPFGGVRVRAPFVSVDVLPNGGGTRVRAPFTAVDTPPYRYRAPGYRSPGYRPSPGYRGPVYPAPAVPAYPSAGAVPAYPNGGYVYPQPDDRQSARPAAPGSVREALLASAEQLKRSLSARRDDGDVWLNYLQPDRVIETIRRGESGDSLRPLLRNYDGVAANAGLSSISGARGFRETHQWLRALVERRPGASRGVLAPVDEGDNESVPAPPPEPGTDQPVPPPAAEPAGEGAESASEEIPLPLPPTPL
jgi:hypothetical protein